MKKLAKGKPCPYVNCREPIGRYWLKTHGTCPHCGRPVTREGGIPEEMMRPPTQ